MKLRGYTNSSDWHPITLLAMMADRNCWYCGLSWREWKLSASYDWYDGPLFQLWVGPFWITLS